ncbi:hypothetical protein PSP6_440229 [Paraburkholderia tropica]|nr:hypothetical protein PSP6_440229 [Paraburkholderia tropica]
MCFRRPSPRSTSVAQANAAMRVAHPRLTRGLSVFKAAPSDCVARSRSMRYASVAQCIGRAHGHTRLHFHALAETTGIRAGVPMTSYVNSRNAP